jgi:hypothetical protein
MLIRDKNKLFFSARSESGPLVGPVTPDRMLVVEVIGSELTERSWQLGVWYRSSP